METEAAPPEDDGDPREARLGELLDEFQDRIEAGPGLDVSAIALEFLAEQDAALRSDLAELIDLTLSLRAGSGSASGGPAHGDFRAPSSIGPYTIDRELGRGGMGIVYLGHDPRLERDVALKVLPAFGNDDTDLRARFEAESKAVARLEHPNIVPLFEAGEADGVAFLAMQYIEGPTLAALRPSAPQTLAAEDVARIVRDLARALSFAHGRGVLHRDVKTTNVLMDKSGKPWILDFGICQLEAREKPPSPQGERDQQVAGTLRTMAPEQIDGRGDERSDVWGLGLILHELLTGQLAFPQLRATELIRAIRSSEPTRPSRIRSQLSADLESITRKAHATLPSERYASAAALADDLDAFLSGTPISARPPTALYLARLFAGRHRGIVLALTGAALAIIAVTWIAFSSVRSQRDRAEAEAYAARIAAAHAAIAYGESGRALQLLGAKPPGLGGWEWHHLRARADQTLSTWRPFAEHRDGLDVISVDAAQGRVLVAGLHGWAIYDRSQGEGDPLLALDARDDLDHNQQGCWIPGTNSFALGRWPDELRIVARGSDAADPPSGWTSTKHKIDGLPTAMAGVPGGSVLAGTDTGRFVEWTPTAEPALHQYARFSDTVAWCGIDDSAEGEDRRVALTLRGLMVWFDAKTGAELKRLDLGENRVALAALSMDFRTGSALLGDALGAVRRVDLVTGETLERFAATDARRTDGVRIGDVLVSGSHGGERLALHHLDEPERQFELSGHSAPVWSVDADAHRGLVFTGDREGILAAWDPHALSGVTELRGHENDVWGLDLSADGRLLATSGRDGLVVVWDLERAEPWRVFGPFGAGVGAVAFTGDERQLVVSVRHGELHTLDLETGDPVGSVVRPGSSWIEGIDAAHPSRLYVSTWNGVASLAQSTEGGLTLEERVDSAPLGGQPGMVRWVAGQLFTVRLASRNAEPQPNSSDDGGPRGAVLRLDPDTLEVLWRIPLGRTPMGALDVSEDGNELLVIDGPGTVLRLGAALGSELSRYTLPSDNLSPETLLRVQFGPDAAPGPSRDAARSVPHRIAATSVQGSAYVWDRETGALSLDLDAHVGYGTALHCAGNLLITGGSDRLVTVHHLQTASDLRHQRLNTQVIGDPAVQAAHRAKLTREGKLSIAREALKSGDRAALRASWQLLDGRQRASTRATLTDPEMTQVLVELKAARSRSK